VSTNDLISIILPTYNRARLLSRALDSVLAQTYPHIQIIIADDGSSDNTTEIIQPYLVDSRIIYFKNKKNIGCHPNIRKALFEFAQGKYCFIMSDDNYLLDENFFKQAVFSMQKHQSKILFSNHVTIFENKKKTYSIKEHQDLPESMTGEAMYFGWHSPIYLNSQTTLFDLAYARDFLNPYDKNIVFADQELWFRFFLSPNCLCSFLKCHSVGFVSHVSSMTMKQNLDEFINGLVWCSSTEELAKKQFDKDRVTRHVNFLLTNTLINAVGPIVTLKNIFYFNRLLKIKNPRAHQLFLPALLKNPKRILRLFLSCSSFLYFACSKLYNKWRIFKGSKKWSTIS
jgi:glycosyltransferase involved in cell wall biosynthesis